MKITVHGELNISRLTENNFAKSHFTATMEITIHEEKISHFTFHGKKRANRESRKYPLPPSQYNALIKMLYSCYCDVIMRSSVMVKHRIEVSHREIFAKE